MLDNNPGIKEFDKLRSILLMEEYFNFINKNIIGVHMMRAVEKS